MQAEVLEKLKGYYKYFSANGVLDFVILGLAVISASFLSYIHYFDINALALVDSGTLTKHVLVVSLHYAGSLAFVSVSLLLFQNVMTSKEVVFLMSRYNTIDIDLAKILPRSVRFALWSFLEKRILRTTLTILVFSLAYMGLVNTLKLIAITALLAILVSYFYLRFLSEDNGLPETEVVRFFGDKVKIHIPLIPLTDEVKEKSSNYFTAKIGVVVLYLALAIGIGRANYITNSTKVAISGEDQELVIVASSSSGLILYDLEAKIVLFKPWSKVGTLELPIENQRSLRKEEN